MLKWALLAVGAAFLFSDGGKKLLGGTPASTGGGPAAPPKTYAASSRDAASKVAGGVGTVGGAAVCTYYGAGVVAPVCGKIGGSVVSKLDALGRKYDPGIKATDKIINWLL